MSTTLPIDDSTDIVSMLLAEQQSMTAVERFSSLHDEGLDTQSPAQEKYYRELLPASPPGPGQQFAFEVDLDKCSGCKACVVACHTLNGLEEDEAWRRVGTITIGETPQVATNSLPLVQHVTTACHHCEDPGCLNGCPVKAYDKDAVTGIVRHLDDQCIGCKYCTMMCPYEVPRYSERLGIVRKCDMCHQRLSVGEAPACVQACPNEAIAIKVVDTDQQFDTEDRLAPGSPTSDITKPTTRYVSSRNESVASGMPQDTGVDEVAESHWPLALMLIGTQVSVGMILMERLVAGSLWVLGQEIDPMLPRVNALAAFIIGAIGLNIAALHLGQPLRAWRVFLGLRTSWLSREAVILGKYMGMLSAAVGLLWMPVFADYVPEFVKDLIPGWAGTATLAFTIPVGIAGLYSSAMIYIATKRVLWRTPRTLIRFFGTAVFAGLAGTASIASMTGHTSSAVLLGVMAASTLIAKFVWEYRVHFGGNSQDDWDRRSRRIVREHLSVWLHCRVVGFSLGVMLIVLGCVLAFASPVIAGILLGIGALAAVIGDSFERLMYFSSVVYDRMPGTL